MVPVRNVKMTVCPIWNTGGTETEIIVPVSVLGPQRAGTEMVRRPPFAVIYACYGERALKVQSLS